MIPIGYAGSCFRFYDVTDKRGLTKHVVRLCHLGRVYNRRYSSMFSFIRLILEIDDLLSFFLSCSKTRVNFITVPRNRLCLSVIQF